FDRHNNGIVCDHQLAAPIPITFPTSRITICRNPECALSTAIWHPEGLQRGWRSQRYSPENASGLKKSTHLTNRLLSQLNKYTDRSENLSGKLSVTSHLPVGSREGCPSPSGIEPRNVSMGAVVELSS